MELSRIAQLRAINDAEDIVVGLRSFFNWHPADEMPTAVRILFRAQAHINRSRADVLDTFSHA